MVTIWKMVETGIETRRFEMIPGRISLLAQHISTDEAMMVIVPIYGVILIVLIVANWKLFAKAGQPGWASIIPIYNLVVLLQIVGRPTWWIAAILFCPPVGLVFSVIMMVDLAKSFGKGGGFAAGLILLGFIFFPILAFGSSQYQGPAGASTE